MHNRVVGNISMSRRLSASGSAALPISMYRSWSAKRAMRLPLSLLIYCHTAGTMPKPVTCSVSMTLKNVFRLAKLLTSTSVAPAMSTQRKRPKPNEWLNGNANASISSGRVPINPLVFRAEPMMLAWERSTPLGAPVVPVVNMMSATSSLVSDGTAISSPAIWAGTSSSAIQRCPEISSPLANNTFGAVTETM